jgi:hypothetical protein
MHLCVFHLSAYGAEVIKAPVWFGRGEGKDSAKGRDGRTWCVLLRELLDLRPGSTRGLPPGERHCSSRCAHPPSPVATASSRLCPRGGTQHLLLGGVANRAGGVLTSAVAEDVVHTNVDGTSVTAVGDCLCDEGASERGEPIAN